jgi:hypothetical protein
VLSVRMAVPFQSLLSTPPPPTSWAQIFKLRLAVEFASSENMFLITLYIGQVERHPQAPVRPHRLGHPSFLWDLHLSDGDAVCARVAGVFLVVLPLLRIVIRPSGHISSWS